MRNSIILCALLLGPGSTAVGQSDWCVPVVDVANSSMSGIMNVSLNGTPALDRSSPTTEGYLHAGNTTTLVRGGLYTLSIDKDAGIDCPDLNIRAYIDFNRDHVFSESTETVALLNYAGDGIDDFTFIVPYTAVDGPTRLRVCEKQIMECGMVPINSCGLGDTLSYRGEIEDYTIIISGQVGVGDPGSPSDLAAVVIDGTIMLTGELRDAHLIEAEVFDLAGRRVLQSSLAGGSATEGPVAIGDPGRSGVFILTVNIDGGPHAMRVFVD